MCLLCMMLLAGNLFAQEEQEIIEHHGDRYIINVDVLKPDKEMTLLDVLQTCPELLSEHGKRVKSDYELYIDNVTLPLDNETLLEALNTDLVCDAINTAMRELFLQIVYGRTQSAFSEGGLLVGASLEDLGKGLRSQIGTMFATKEKGPRYLEMTEGYCSRMALNADGEIIGYEFVSLGKMMDFIKGGMDANEALKKATGHYGQWDAAVKYIDPRKE